MLRTSLLTILSLTLAAQDAPKPAPAPTAKAEAKPAAAPAAKPAAAPAAKPAAAPAAKAEAAPAAKAEAKPAEKPAEKPVDKIIAKVGDRLVRQSDVDNAIAAMPQQQQQQVLKAAGGKEMYSKSFIEMQLLAAKARKSGLEKTDSYKRKADVALTQVLATELLAKEGPALQAKMELKEEDVKAYYEKNKAQFMGTEKFNARHILVSVKTDRTPTGGTDEEAKAKIAKIEAELKAGKKFEDLAKEYSDDPGSKDKGGLYENISFGTFVPEFEKAVRVQEIGKVGPAVKSSFGYHLIQVEKILPVTQEPFESVKEKAHSAATKDRQEQVWNAFLADIKKDIPFQAGGEISAPAPKAASKAAKKATK